MHTTNRTRRPLLLLILAATALRLGGADIHDLWIDEAFSLWMARHTLPVLVETTGNLDHHPPLYYILLRGWIAIGGESEFALRALSAWVGIATVPLFFQWGRILVGDRVSLLATIFLVMSPFHMAFAQEARMYALLAFAAILTLYLATTLLHSDKPSTLYRNAMFLAVGQTLVMWSHNTAPLLFPVALNLAAVALYYARHTPQMVKAFPAFATTSSIHLLRAWLVSQVGAAILWALWLPALIRQALEINQRFWVQPPNVDTLWAAFQVFSFGHTPFGELVGEVWVALFVCVGLAGVFGLRAKPGMQAALLMLWLAGPAVSLALSLYRPIFLESTLIWTTFSYYLILATGCLWIGAQATALEQVSVRLPLGALSKRGLARAAAGVLLLGMAGGVWGYYTGAPKEAWREAAAVVLGRIQPSDLLLFHASWGELPFLYYADRYAPNDERADGEWEYGGVPVDLFDRGELEPEMRPEDVETLRQRVRGRERVWLIYSHSWYTDPAGFVPGVLAEEFSLAYFVELTGMDISLYRKPN